MEFTKNTWAKDDVITSALLNRMETGIGDAAAAVNDTAARLATVEGDVTQLKSDVADAKSSYESAAALISTNAENIQKNAADIEQAAQDAAAHIAASQEALQQLNEGLDAIAEAKTAAATADSKAVAAQGAADAAQAAADAAQADATANGTAITGLDGRVTTLEGMTHLTPADFGGLVSIKGQNASSTQHVIKTMKNGVLAVEAILFNEAVDGGGAMLRDHENDMVCYLGVNRGFVDQGIYSQFYAKKISTNEGCRCNFTDEGLYVTYGKKNAQYVEGDKLLTKTEIQTLMESIIDSYEARIAALETEVETLKNSGPTLQS